jgi:outer membrane protein
MIPKASSSKSEQRSKLHQLLKKRLKEFVVKKLLVSSMLAVSLSMTSAAFAEKYAVVDMQKAATDTNYMKTQRASLDAALKPQQQTHERLTKEITDLQNKAQAEGKNMKEADLRKLEQDYASKMSAYNENAANMQKRVQSSLETINGTLGPKIDQVVDNLRKQGGYSIVLDRKAVVSYDPAIDLTTQVTQQVNAVLK